MCGITGSVSRTPELIRIATDRLAHRGPDASAYFFRDVSAGRTLALGHRRLSIIDLSDAANQPFASPCGRYRMVFNGEIYNWVSLRAELSGLGMTFATQSDSEVLLNAYRLWGEACLDRLDGMYAFGIWDEQTQDLFLGRDPFGIKPLYYRHDEADGTICFASEIDALLSMTGGGEVDRDSFAEFLLNGFLYEPNTGIQGVKKLGPGEAARFDTASGRLRTWRYTPAFPVEDASLPDLIEGSVALQARADVPVGLFFSGGLDSTVLAAAYPGKLTGLMMDYSADPSDVGIDQSYATRIADALGFPLITQTGAEEGLSREEIVADFNLVAAGIDEPISDFTYIATRALSRSAREQGFKVMLSGMGGDELFAGYPRLRIARLWNAIRASGMAGRGVLKLLSRQRSMAKRAERLRGFVDAETFAEGYTRLIGYLSFDQVERLLGEPVRDRYLHQMEALAAPVRDLSPLKQALYLDRLGFLSHNLTVTDRASMAESIEVRVPLITPPLGAWAAAQRDDALINTWETKRPLRDYARTKLPKALVDRPKQGFNPPLDHRIDRLGRGGVIDVMEQAGLFDHIDRKTCLGLVESHFSRAANQTYCLWQLLYFGLWLDQRRRVRLSQATQGRSANGELRVA